MFIDWKFITYFLLELDVQTGLRLEVHKNLTNDWTTFFIFFLWGSKMQVYGSFCIGIVSCETKTMITTRGREQLFETSWSWTLHDMIPLLRCTHRYPFTHHTTHTDVNGDRTRNFSYCRVFTYEYSPRGCPRWAKYPFTTFNQAI